MARSTAIAVLAATLASFASPSPASSKGGGDPELEWARAELGRIDVELSLIARRLHDARETLRSMGGRIASASRQSTRATLAAVSADAELDARARFAYQSVGSSSGLSAILGLESISQVNEGLGYLTSLAEHDRRNADRAIATLEHADETMAELRALFEGQRVALAGLRRAQAELEAAAQEQADLIRVIERRIRRELIMPVTDPEPEPAPVPPPPPPPPPTPDPTPTPTPTPTPSPSAPAPEPSPSPAPTLTPDPEEEEEDVIVPPAGDGPLSNADMEALIAFFWRNAEARSRARCIAWHESRFIPTARNPASGSSGLFQFMPFWWNGNNEYDWRFDPYDPVENARHAFYLWKAQGWEPWTTWRFCR